MTTFTVYFVAGSISTADDSQTAVVWLLEAASLRMVSV